jgi:hypothetical protein
VGIWLQRTPEAHQTLLLNLAKDSDLEAGIDTLRDLMLDGALRGVPCLYPAPRNGPLLRDLPMPRPQVWTEDALDEYGRQTGLGRWTARVGLWEDREVLVYKAAKIKRLWEQIPDAAVQEGRIYAPDEYDQITNQTEKIHTGIPTLQLIENTPAHLGHVGFSPSCGTGGHRSSIRHRTDEVTPQRARHPVLRRDLLCRRARR